MAAAIIIRNVWKCRGAAAGRGIIVIMERWLFMPPRASKCWLVIAIVLSLLSFDFSAVAAKSALNSLVCYIGIRTDGVAGTGNADDPFDGSDSEKLKEIFKSMPDGARLVFGPGTYFVGTGLALASGKSLSILGSNRTKTILKLQDHLPSGESRAKIAGGIVLNFWGSGDNYSQASSLYIADLTLDANVGGSPQTVNFTADALHTNYPTVVVERVDIVNCGGTENYPTESFHVAVWYPNPDNLETRKWHWYQRLSDLRIVVRSGQTHTATVLGVGTANGQPPMVPLNAVSIIENSLFDISAGQDSTYAAGVVGRNGAFFRNNVMILRDHATAMNADTWDHAGTTVEQNKFFLYDHSSGVRLGSGPDEGTFSDDWIKDNQFFVASPKVVFAIQLNGVTRPSVTGNQFLSYGGATGSLTPVDVCNTYTPHKNEAVVIRDNLVDTRMFKFPMAKLRGDPKEGVVTICEGNRSFDGTEEDGSSNGMMAERTIKTDLSLGLTSAETQVLAPQSKGLRVLLPRIAKFLTDAGTVLPGKRFCLINSGLYSLSLVVAGDRQSTRLAPGATVEFVATSNRWVTTARTTKGRE